VLILGLVVRQSGVRILALALCLLTTAKVFLIDIWQLSATIRTFAFLGLGVALLFISWLYRRHRDRLQDWITGE